LSVAFQQYLEFFPSCRWEFFCIISFLSFCSFKTPPEKENHQVSQVKLLSVLGAS